MQSQTETQRLTTIRFSLPSDLSSMVKNMKPIGNDLLVYVSDSNVKSVTDKFTGMGLSSVQREYKLHISAPNEETFTKVFGSVEKEVRESLNKYVVSVSVDSKDEYDKLLELNGTNDCRVKPFRNLNARMSSSRFDEGHQVQRFGGQGQSQRYSSRQSDASLEQRDPRDSRDPRDPRSFRGSRGGFRGGFRGRGDQRRPDSQRELSSSGNNRNNV